MKVDDDDVSELCSNVSLLDEDATINEEGDKPGRCRN